MANQPNQPGGDGIWVPVNLDTTQAAEQFDQLKESIKKADLRPNQDLDDFFDASGTAAAKAAKEVAEYRKQLQDLNREAKNADAKRMMGNLSAPAKFQMNMAAMAAKSYRSFDPEPRSRVYSNEYQKQVGRYESSRQNSYEQTFQNRYLQSELDDGSYRKQVRQTLNAELAEKKLMAQRDKMLRQTRLIERQERYGRLGGLAAHLYGENAAGFQKAGQMAGRGAGYGLVGAAGLAASGFSGTIEGERFAKELRVLSLELAASFKPLVDTLTSMTRQVRKNLQTMTPSQQDRLQQGGLAAGGALIGGRLFGPWGAAVGATAGAGLGEGLRRSSAKERGLFSEYSKSGDLPGMTNEKRLEEIKKRRDELTGGGIMGKFSVAYARYFGKEGEADELSGKLRALDEMKRATEKAMKPKDWRDTIAETGDKMAAAAGVSGTNPDRRQLMITEGTGFAGAGSTFFALQEEGIRTAAAENATQTQILERIASGVENLNK